MLAFTQERGKGVAVVLCFFCMSLHLRTVIHTVSSVHYVLWYVFEMGAAQGLFEEQLCVDTDSGGQLLGIVRDHLRHHNEPVQVIALALHPVDSQDIQRPAVAVQVMTGLGKDLVRVL